MSEWPEVQLGEVADELTVGHVGPMAAEYVSSGVPFLRSQNVKPFRLEFDDVRYITPEFHHRLRKSALKPGDVVVVRTGQPGTAAVVPSDLPVANCSDLVIIRPGDLIDSRWLVYFINGASRGYVHSRLVGAVQQHFNVGAAREMILRMPPISEQRAIAEVLGALDDKIESNRRRIKLLDELFMTECSSLLIHAKIDGVQRLADIAEISLGGTPSRANAEFWVDGAIPWINSGCLHERPVLTPADFITELGCAKSATKVIPAGATVVAITGATLGVISRLGISCAINQSVVAITSREVLNDTYLHFWMRSNIADLVSSATGAAQQHVNKSNFEELRVEIPTRSVLDQVGAHGVLLDRQVSLAKEVRTLVSLRDALLPELLSGRLRVREAEKALEGAL